MQARARPWRWAEADSRVVRRLVARIGCPVPVARLLASRGITSTAAARALLQSPAWRPGLAGPLPGLDRAAERIARAIRAGRQIVVFGDFDADGVTATALLTRHLRELGGRVEPFLPRRVEEGYGLSVAAAARCARSLEPDMIVTVDCGTNSPEAVFNLRAAGVEVIVTDHHLPEGAPPPADVVVNPHLVPDPPTAPLAGVGIALELALAVDGRLRRPTRGRAPGALLELAAIGTVADCVPLKGANRAIVRAGLDALRRTDTPGLLALMDAARVPAVCGAWEIAFLIAPRLNAAGRVGMPDLALELLLTTDGARAAELARQLEEANRQRQQIEQRVLDRARRQIERGGHAERDFALVAAGRGWHPGVVGIIAARLAAQYRRPVAVITVVRHGHARGSVRGVEGVDVAAALRECAAVLARYGGHASAAGLEIDPGRVPRFAALFNEAVRRQLDGRRPEPPLHVDAPIELHEISLKLLDWIERLGPYGHGFPTPIWAARGVEVADWRIVKDLHVQMELRQGAHGCRAIAFRQAERPRPGGRVDVAFELKRNEWNGEIRADLHVADWRESPGDD